MIEQFNAGMDFEAFRANPMAIAVVEGKVQIIGEAAVRPGTEAEVRCPGIPCRDIRGIGNHLRLAYERIDLASIWRAAADNLPALKVRVQSAITD